LKAALVALGVFVVAVANEVLLTIGLRGRASDRRRSSPS
jgi:hypothetical protein